MRIVGLTGHSICLIPVGCGCSWRIVRIFEPIKLPMDPAAEVASVGNCIIPVWCMQTGFRVSQASLHTVFRLPSSGLSSSFSFPTTQRGSSFSGVSSCQESCENSTSAGWACSSMGAREFGSAQDERHKVAVVLQWQEDSPRHPLRRVQGVGCRHVCRSAGALQLAGRGRGC